MDDDVKMIGQKSKLKENTLEWNHQSAMLTVSSSVVNHATLWTAGKPGNITQKLKYEASTEYTI